jgi:hypothetical protein
MSDKSVQFVEKIIQSTPNDQLISYDDAIGIAMNLLMLNGRKAPIEEIIRLLKQRFIEDLITIQIVTPIAADSLLKQNMISAEHDDNLQFVKTITDELRKFPGGYAKHNSQELQPLVFKILGCSENEEWLIYNLEPKAMLLDTDMGMATIGFMAMLQQEHDDLRQVLEKRSRLALARKEKRDDLDGLE